MKTTMSEMTNILNKIMYRLHIVKEKSKLKNITKETIQKSTQKKIEK